METPINCEELDKRTKAYKECIKAQESKGLGDTIEKVTKATGIKKAVDWFSDKTGIDCGCDKRKEKLNQLFPYKKPECLTKEEYEYLHEFFTKPNRLVVTLEEQRRMVEIYNRVFSGKKKVSSCGPCVKGLTYELHTLYKEY